MSRGGSLGPIVLMPGAVSRKRGTEHPVCARVAGPAVGHGHRRPAVQAGAAEDNISLDLALDLLKGVLDLVRRVLRFGGAIGAQLGQDFVAEDGHFLVSLDLGGD